MFLLTSPHTHWCSARDPVDFALGGSHYNFYFPLFIFIRQPLCFGLSYSVSSACISAWIHHFTVPTSVLYCSFSAAQTFCYQIHKGLICLIKPLIFSFRKKSCEASVLLHLLFLRYSPCCLILMNAFRHIALPLELIVRQMTYELCCIIETFMDLVGNSSWSLLSVIFYSPICIKCFWFCLHSVTNLVFFVTVILKLQTQLKRSSIFPALIFTILVAFEEAF